jgi:hypothetical protein
MQRRCFQPSSTSKGVILYLFLKDTPGNFRPRRMLTSYQIYRMCFAGSSLAHN